MARDLKYGNVALERGDVEEDEPVIIFRARDSQVPALLALYAWLCIGAGSPDFHINLIARRRREFIAWQDAHPSAVRVPTSADYLARISEQ